MTDPIDERTAAREAALLDSMGGQRRLARPEDYVFDKREEKFWDLEDLTLHSHVGVDASIPQELWRVVVEEAEEPEEGAPRRRGRPRRRERLVKPSIDIMRVENDQFVEGAAWWPGKERIIQNYYIDADGPVPSPGRRILNKFRDFPEPEGDAAAATPWVEHVKRLWPDKMTHEFIFNYCAHMVQRPHEKCNAAVIMSGAQRIGKDAVLHALKDVIGVWNTKDISPDDLFSSNSRPWVQTLMLIVNEVRPSNDEFHASSMYNILKPFIAAPPHVLPRAEKYEKLTHVINVMRVFMTTNDWMAMYIPPSDGRMFIAHSTLETDWQDALDPDYFKKLYGWMDAGGSKDVGAWLRARDISEFNPQGKVPKTMGWKAVAASWDEPDDCVMQALEAMGSPPVVFGTEMAHLQFDGADEMAGMLRSPRKIAHRMTRAGYAMVKSDTQRWSFKIGGQSFTSRLAFVKSSLMTEGDGAKKLIEARGRELVKALAEGAARVGKK